MTAFSQREQIVETVNKLFVYTDSQQWEALQQQVFAAKVHLDMSSLGGPVDEFASGAICDMWSEGFKDLDAINHLGGNYIVNIQSAGTASVLAYATATHYKKSAKQGTTREFVGTYDLGLKNTENGWRIDSFTYKLKYMQGNLELE